MHGMRFAAAIDANRLHELAHPPSLVVERGGDVLDAFSGGARLIKAVERRSLSRGFSCVMCQEVMQASAPFGQCKAWFGHQPGDAGNRRKIDATREAARASQSRTTGGAGEQFSKTRIDAHARIMPECPTGGYCVRRRLSSADARHRIR